MFQLRDKNIAQDQLLQNRFNSKRFRGVTVSTLDSESSDPSSNLGGAYILTTRQIQ